LAQYLALQLAHIERYTFKKNISSLVPDVNSRISLHLGYRSSPTVWDGGSSVDINAAPFFADGGGTIKSVEPVYMAPYSYSVPNLLPYLTLEEKTMFDFLNNHHNMTLWESLIGKEYIFKNYGEYSLDDYYKYQESSEVFFNRIKKPGSIWNGIDFFFPVDSDYVFCGCSKCEHRDYCFYTRCTAFTRRTVHELLCRGPRYENIYEFDGLFMCADSPEELEGIIMWYVLLCPHESATRYCVYVHKNVQYSTHYKNFFSYESCPSLTARINMSVPTEKKRSYVGKTRMSRMGFQVMSRMPHFYELMKDKDYRREYDALIQERELVDSKQSVKKMMTLRYPVWIIRSMLLIMLFMNI